MRIKLEQSHKLNNDDCVYYVHKICYDLVDSNFIPPRWFNRQTWFSFDDAVVIRHGVISSKLLKVMYGKAV